MLAQTNILTLKPYAEIHKNKRAGTNELTLRIWIKLSFQLLKETVIL
jgi:hypothetical protein